MGEAAAVEGAQRETGAARQGVDVDPGQVRARPGDGRPQRIGRGGLRHQRLAELRLEARAPDVEHVAGGEGVGGGAPQSASTIASAMSIPVVTRPRSRIARR